MNEEYRSRSAGFTSSEATSCGAPLDKGRTCCHLKGHDGRHGHTWHWGDYRLFALPDGRWVNGETGELFGGPSTVPEMVAAEREAMPVNARRSPEDARRVLRAHWYVQIEEIVWEADVTWTPPTANWHYVGDGRRYGTDPSGHSIMWDEVTGRVCRLYAIGEKREAVRLVAEVGISAAEASRKLDIPAASIRQWKHRGIV